jgi:hypothetical protein
MPSLGHHMVRVFAFFGLLFLVGLVAALRERQAKIKRHSRLP